MPNRFSPIPQQRGYVAPSLQETALAPLAMQERDMKMSELAGDMTFNVNALPGARDQVQKDLADFKQRRDQLASDFMTRGWSPEMQSEFNKLKNDWRSYAEEGQGFGSLAQSDYERHQQILEDYKDNPDALKQYYAYLNSIGSEFGATPGSTRFAFAGEEGYVKDGKFVPKGTEGATPWRLTSDTYIPTTERQERFDKLLKDTLSGLGEDVQKVLAAGELTPIYDEDLGVYILQIDESTLETSGNERQVALAQQALYDISNTRDFQEAFQMTGDLFPQVYKRPALKDGQPYKDENGNWVMEEYLSNPIHERIANTAGSRISTGYEYNPDIYRSDQSAGLREKLKRDDTGTIYLGMNREFADYSFEGTALENFDNYELVENDRGEVIGVSAGGVVQAREPGNVADTVIKMKEMGESGIEQFATIQAESGNPTYAMSFQTFDASKYETNDAKIKAYMDHHTNFINQFGIKKIEVTVDNDPSVNEEKKKNFLSRKSALTLTPLNSDNTPSGEQLGYYDALMKTGLIESDEYEDLVGTEQFDERLKQIEKDKIERVGSADAKSSGVGGDIIAIDGQNFLVNSSGPGNNIWHGVDEEEHTENQGYVQLLEPANNPAKGISSPVKVPSTDGSYVEYQTERIDYTDKNGNPKFVIQLNYRQPGESEWTTYAGNPIIENGVKYYEGRAAIEQGLW